MLSDQQEKKLKNKLEKAKKSLEDQLLKFAKADLKKKGNYKTKFPKIGYQADENAQEITEYEQSISLEHNFENELKLIQKALRKMDKGKYGICESCKKEIPYGRLEIRPQSLLCITCKSKKEKGA